MGWLRVPPAALQRIQEGLFGALKAPQVVVERAQVTGGCLASTRALFMVLIAAWL